MEWSKLKNVILLMLVLVNAALLILVGAQTRRASRYTEETRQAALTVLEQGGISFDLEDFPDDLSLPFLTVTRDRTGESAVASALLGQVTQEEGSEVRSRYSGSGGTAEFSMNGSFSIALEPGTWALQAGEDYQQASADCLTAMGFSGLLESQAVQDGEQVLTYRQQWDGYPLFSCQVTLHWSDGQLLLVEGQRLDGSATLSSNTGLLSTSSILIRFLAGLNKGGHVCSRITDITHGYLSSGLSRSVQLTPVWRIATDTGVYYINGLTGDFTSLE